MHASPSLVLRAGRAVTALITVWCLGCASFESLLTSLRAGDGAGVMSCAFDGMAPAAASASMVASTSAAGSMVTVSHTERGVSCDCTSCSAPTPQLPPVAAVLAPSPTIEPATPMTPSSITRTPIAPPPEAAA